MRRLVLLLPLALGAPGCDCSGGLQLEGDADASPPVDDAGGTGDARTDEAPDADDSGLAPPCAEPPEGCLTAEFASTVEVNRFRVALGGGDIWPDNVMQGLSADGSSGPVFFYAMPIPTSDLREATDHLRLLTFDEVGAAAGELVELGIAEHALGLGDVLALPDGSALVGWRTPDPDYPGHGYAYRTQTFDVADGAVAVSDVLHESEPAAVDQVSSDATAVEAGGRTWIVSGGPDGVLLSPADDPARVVAVPADPPPTHELRAAALSDGRIVVAWSQWIPPAGSGMASAAATIVDPEGTVVPATEIFPPRPDLYGDVYLAVLGSDVYVGRYDRDDSSLRESRIRVARLDESLRRVEPDRWINGWGGVTPGGMALVAWRGGVWVVFQTLDARYGTNPALFAQRLAADDCGYAVDIPVDVLPPHWFRKDTLLAAPGDDEIWTMIVYVEDNATANLYRLVPCE